jgi:putative transposase
LGKTFGCVRFVYNRALQMRKNHYAEDKTSVSYGQTSAALTGWKKEKGCVWLNEVSCVPLQQCLRHLQSAFRNFLAKRAAFPRFESKHGEQGAEFTRSAFTWDGKQNNLRLAKIGHLRVRWSRQFRSEPSTVTITKNRAGQCFVTRCLDEQVDTLPKTGESAGLDLGITHMATLSNGERIANPRFLAKKLAKLRRHQSRLVDRFFPSSKRCSECHFVVETLPLEVRTWTCPECGTVHDRDKNAAKNILAEGHSAMARGGHVRPKATRVVRGSARRSVNQPALP